MRKATNVGDSLGASQMDGERSGLQMTSEPLDSSSDSYERALRLARGSERELAQALELLQQAHADGDVRATYALASWYLYGEQVEKDYQKAVSLLKVCAAKFYPSGLYDLAVAYELGHGVARDLRRAFELYLAAGIRGDAQAIEETGRCYFYGVGIGEDRDLAVVWYARARELGVGESDDPVTTEDLP